MPYPQFDRRHVAFAPLSERENKVYIERDAIPVDAGPRCLSDAARAIARETAERIRRARETERPRMLTFGAHAIKNGLGPLLIHLVEQGWLTHLATNGAGIIHDWEFAFQGCSSEDVRANVREGRFGIWRETGLYLNLALLVGAFEGLGYGESVGKLIAKEGVEILEVDALQQEVQAFLASDPRRAAAACDLLAAVTENGLAPGWLHVAHRWRRFSVQAAAFCCGVPCTGHPMIGHDIIYTHPLNDCAALGRTAQRDFLSFAESVSRIEGGVYLSVGSAVMSPMVFEKSLSMAQNVALQEGRRIEGHFMAVVDLQESHWDWRQGEPPEDNPDYYLRYNKTFARMGGEMRYASADNRDFLLALLQELEGVSPGEPWQERGSSLHKTRGTRG